MKKQFRYEIKIECSTDLQKEMLLKMLHLFVDSMKLFFRTTNRYKKCRVDSEYREGKYDYE